MGGRYLPRCVCRRHETLSCLGPSFIGSRRREQLVAFAEHRTAPDTRAGLELTERALAFTGCSPTVDADSRAVGFSGHRPVIHLRKNTGVSLARVSWITVLGLAAIAVLLLAINGYTGYSITAGAVGLAAAANVF